MMRVNDDDEALAIPMRKAQRPILLARCYHEEKGVLNKKAIKLTTCLDEEIIIFFRKRGRDYCARRRKNFPFTGKIVKHAYRVAFFHSISRGGS